jgi:alpha-mannosidase
LDRIALALQLDEQARAEYGEGASPARSHSRPLLRPRLCAAMEISELTVLLPCHGLEDFPVYVEGPQADELLAAWCAPWHPQLMATAGAVPGWRRIDIPPEALSGLFVALPPYCAERLPAGFLARAEQESAGVIQPANYQAAASRPETTVDPQLVADFMALGFCRLQMELLSRQMRYALNLDETYFQNEAVAAARAAIGGDDTQARTHLQHCFDALYDARKHFYPVDVYLLDITLLADTTLGASLSAELAGETSTNLLAPSSLLKQLHREHQDNWRRLLSGIDAGKVCVLGGGDEERELPLLPLEQALASLAAGVKEYEALLGRPPSIYGQRRAGLWPVLPQLLAKLGYQGAMHFTLDDGRFPLGPQCKTRWEGYDMSVIDIFARVPMDAARAETFLSLSRSTSDSMDSDHVATLAFAHWPGTVSPWHGLLRRIAGYSPVLGKFTLADDYFMHTDMPGRLSKFEADDYRVPYLKQAIVRRQSDPISSMAEAHRRQIEQAAIEALATTCDLVAATSAQAEQASSTTQAELGRLARLLPRGAGATAPRVLVFNPTMHQRRMGLCWPASANLPDVNGPVVAVGASDGRKFAVADVPAMGFAWLEPAATTAPPKPRETPIAQDHSLANEFLEVRISRTTGGIQALYNYAQRGNQLSQQLAARLPGGEPTYTTMRAESVEITAATPAYGEITSAGALVDAAGKALARFRQVTGLWAGSRVVRLDVELSDVEEPRADPWNAYYSVRFAWPDETAELFRGVSSARKATRAGRVEAPEFIDLESASGRVTILTGGLPYHRRSDPRMLDSLLVARGESARRFTLGVGVDLEHPAADAGELLLPASMHLETGPPPKSASGWFFHLGAANVIATHWRPLVEATVPGGPAQVAGFGARLLEVAGRAGRVPLRAFRSVAQARQVNFLGEPILELTVDDDRIMLDFGPHELLEVEARWK